MNLKLTKKEEELLKYANLEKIEHYLRFHPFRRSVLENEAIRTKNIPAIIELAKLPRANVSKLEDAVIATGNAGAMFEFAMKVPGANIAKLEDAIMRSYNLKAIKRFLMEVKKKSLAEVQEYISNVFEIEEYLDTYKKNKFSINQGISIDQVIELLNILTLDKVTSLFEQGFLPNEIFEYYLHRLQQEKIIYQETTNQVDETWLVNLSLTEPNILPSMVKDHKEVLENTKLYLELLKKMDNNKYYDYKDAFDGKITFEKADQYYLYRYKKLK